eukprot:580710-Rhodomonas_salina.1
MPESQQDTDIRRNNQEEEMKSPDDKDGSGFETVMEAVPVHRDELKEFLVKHFTVEGRRPMIIMPMERTLQ